MLSQYRTALGGALVMAALVAALLGWLIARLNQMMARLEEGFLQLSRFSEDLAHEMRTPLNNLIGQSQQCLSRERQTEDYEALLLSNLEEHERLSRMINGMLFLARAEHGAHPHAMEPVSVTATIDKLLDYFSDMAEEQAVQLLNQVRENEDLTLLAAPDLLALVARAEEGITHPFAAALREAAASTGQTLEQPLQTHQNGTDNTADQARAERFQRGVRLIDAQLGQVLVGSIGFLTEMGVATSTAKAGEDTTLSQGADADGSRIEVAIDGHWLATITLQDQLREDAAAALAQLQHMGIRCFIASGDGRGPVQQAARQLQLPEARLYWECSPQGKADLIAQLGSRRVAFAGDGINDGPALAAAEVGIAVADATSTATAAANGVLASGGVTALPTAILHAKRARKVMQQNLFFAVIYNALGLTLAAVGLVSPVMAALAMAASSISVTANASRLALAPATKPVSRP